MVGWRQSRGGRPCACDRIFFRACWRWCWPPAAAPAASTAAALAPELQAIYDRSCASCHSIPASGAPQLGDRQAWAPRLAQGADVLLEHTVTGYKAMPPLGACMDCDEEQFRALIAHLAGAEAPP